MRGIFDIDQLRKLYINLQQESLDSTLWQDKEKAALLLKKKSIIENKLSTFDNIVNSTEYNLELIDLASLENEKNTILECEKELKNIVKKAEKFLTESLFKDDIDNNNCFLEINAGAGGTESYDWAEMMIRMYTRFAERMGFKTEIINILAGEEAGIKSASIRIKGIMAYGWFKTESGVHRLVRISPFNASGKRMTSFASAWVYPEIDDNIAIIINEKDLKIDTYKSSGAGGQHVNTTDSAIRITHLPTGIVVQCQNDRSQHRNKAEAMKMLRARLYNLEIEKKKEMIDEQNAEKRDNSWGRQIRSYVLHPYQMVKDLRTNIETSNVNDILDGNLEKFTSEALAQGVFSAKK